MNVTLISFIMMCTVRVMDTVLNLGMNDEVVEQLVEHYPGATRRFALDTYCKFLRVYGMRHISSFLAPYRIYFLTHASIHPSTPHLPTPSLCTQARPSSLSLLRNTTTSRTLSKPETVSPPCYTLARPLYSISSLPIRRLARCP